MGNFQFLIRSPIYLYLKKHYCPQCSHLLKVIISSRVIYPGLEESEQQNLDFSMVGGAYQSGAVKIMYNEFECPQCNCRITVDKMKEIEGRYLSQADS